MPGARDERYVVVEGPIGVGKTTLARALAAEFGSQPVLEQVEDNPFLRKFYQDAEKYAFPAQLFFLLNRYRQQRELDQRDLFRKGIVADYLFAKDGIFAQVTLGADELHLYQQIFRLLDSRLPRPDLVVYLEARPEVLIARLRKRGRDYERDVSQEYIERIAEAFRSFFHQYTDAPLLVVNCSDVDFEQGGDFTDLIREIRGMRQGVQHYIPLGSR
jgi:deoxyguanosine kinase